MKFSDSFLKSYASLFGQAQADSFLMRNIDSYEKPAKKLKRKPSRQQKRNRAVSKLNSHTPADGPKEDIK